MDRSGLDLRRRSALRRRVPGSTSDHELELAGLRDYQGGSGARRALVHARSQLSLFRPVLNPVAWVNPPNGQFGTTNAHYSDYQKQRRPVKNMTIGRNIRIKRRPNFLIRGGSRISLTGRD